MKVWFCALASMIFDKPLRVCQIMKHGNCRLVRLVPVDAVVLVRDDDGNWPKELLEAMFEARLGMGKWDTSNLAILDALAEAARDNPPG